MPWRKTPSVEISPSLLNNSGRVSLGDPSAVIEQNLFSEQTANEPLFLFVKPQLPSCGRTSHPQHTFSRTDTIVIIRNEPAGLACHLRVYREQLNDAPAIRADLFDDRRGTRLTLAATQHREETFDRRANACGRLSCVIIYYDCLGCTQYHRGAPLWKTTQASRQSNPGIPAVHLPHHNHNLRYAEAARLYG